MSHLVPHFRFPFQLRGDGGKAVCNEQDDSDDIVDCVEVLLSTGLGERQELPEYGLPDQTFSETSADVGIIRAVIEEWEPRAGVDITAEEIEQMIQRVRINVRTNA